MSHNKSMIENYLEKLNSDNKVFNEINPFLLLSAAGLLMRAFETYRNNFNKVAKRCSGLMGRELTICLVNAKLSSKKILLSEIKRKASECSKTKDPQKCLDKFRNKMQIIQDDIDNLQKRYNDLTTKEKEEKRMQK